MSKTELMKKALKLQALTMNSLLSENTRLRKLMTDMVCEQYLWSAKMEKRLIKEGILK